MTVGMIRIIFPTDFMLLKAVLVLTLQSACGKLDFVQVILSEVQSVLQGSLMSTCICYLVANVNVT